MYKADNYINLPCKIFLSREGNVYCTRRGIPLENLVSLDSVKGVGFNRPNIMAPLIQQLTANNLIARIESTDVDFISRRKDIIDTAKLIVYGILYRRFLPSLNAILMDSPVIRSLHARGKIPIRENKIRFDPVSLAAFIEENGKALRSMKASLLFHPYKLIDEDPHFDDEQKKRKKQITRKFIDIISDDTWLLFSLINRSPDKAATIQRMDQMVTSFFKKTNIADAIAFMLVELVQNAETEHFKFMASKDNMARVKGNDIFPLLRDEKFRKKMKARAVRNGSLIQLVFRFRNLKGANNTVKTRIRISVTNKGRMDIASSSHLNRDRRRGEEQVSLADYLQDDPESLGHPIGVAYYRFLEEACRAENVNLESLFSVNQMRNETTATMTVII